MMRGEGAAFGRSEPNARPPDSPACEPGREGLSYGGIHKKLRGTRRLRARGPRGSRAAATAPETPSRRRGKALKGKNQVFYIVLFTIIVTLLLLALTLFFIGKYYWGPSGPPTGSRQFKRRRRR